MSWKCSLPNCKPTRKDVHVIMHRFPRRNREVLEKWLKILDREEWLTSGKFYNSFICDRHFSDKQKFRTTGRNRTNLLYDAFPDQELPHIDNTGTSFETEAGHGSQTPELNISDSDNFEILSSDNHSSEVEIVVIPAFPKTWIDYLKESFTDHTPVEQINRRFAKCVIHKAFTNFTVNTFCELVEEEHQINEVPSTLLEDDAEYTVYQSMYIPDYWFEVSSKVDRRGVHLIIIQKISKKNNRSSGNVFCINPDSFPNFKVEDDLTINDKLVALAKSASAKVDELCRDLMKRKRSDTESSDTSNTSPTVN